MKNFRCYGICLLIVAFMWGIASCNNAGGDKKEGTDTTMKAAGDSATTANAVDPSTAFPQPPVTGTLIDSTMSDTAFIEKSIAGNKAEVALANLALKRSTDKAIKMIANHLKADHTQFLVQLNRLKGGGTDTDTTLTTDAQQLADSLANMPAGQFNTAWTDVMVAKHEKTIKSYKERQKRTKNAQLKQFLTTVLPKVEEHKRTLQSLKKKP